MGLACAGLMGLGLTSCDNGGNTYVDGKLSLNMSVQYAKAETRMEFHANANYGKDVKLPYKDPAGNEYNDGDLKPVWKAVSDKIQIHINDVTPKDSVNDSFTDWQTKGLANVDVFQGGASAIQNYATEHPGDVLDLAEYLDQLPNFKKFLDGNKVVKRTITNYAGNIYYAPYFDGYDDIEKMVLMRVDFVKKLLDGDSLEGLDEDTTAAITPSYQIFQTDNYNEDIKVMVNKGTAEAPKYETGTVKKSYTKEKNPIARQNALASGGKITGKNLVQALRAHIDEAYKTSDGAKYYTKRSDLFIGPNAAYDADELVALLRCVKANPHYLTGDAEKVMYPVFNRENKNSRVGDLFGLMGQMFGVRGMMSKNGYFYFDANGNVVDTRWQQNTVDALERFNQMYKEGLILPNFTSDTAGDGTGGAIYKAVHGNNVGFCSFDYAQTQTVYHETDVAKKIADYDFEPVISPVAKWNGGTTLTRFHESWRSVKTEGWAISGFVKNNEEKLKKCLELFDYFWSTEGQQLMSYGPDSYIAHDKSTGKVETIDYLGKPVPKLADGTLEQLKTIAEYNYTNYYRYFVGGTFPIGYIKEQGMEYQCNAPQGKAGLDKVENAIALGVIEYPDVTWTKTNKATWIIPTTFAFDSTEASAVTTNYTTLNDYVNNTNGKLNNWSNIVMYGFGNTEHDTKTKDEYKTYMSTTLKGNDYVSVHQKAWVEMQK